MIVMSKGRVLVIKTVLLPQIWGLVKTWIQALEKRHLTDPLNPAKKAFFDVLKKAVGGFGLLAYHVKNCAKWGSRMHSTKMPLVQFLSQIEGIYYA